MFHLRHVTLGSLLAATSLSFPLLPASAFACELSEPQKGTVAEVKDGETLALTDGTVVRLVNAKAPTAPMRPNPTTGSRLPTSEHSWLGSAPRLACLQRR